ncbi:MAG: aminotransferase class I/II-fold pyridoxal phosphate-dependent enzyme, partial [Burkholderiales bacterium]|nr:aminotransferase class I/II-fold pyridoxal phosphate-dependent enzyme [Burkholderiales bacterium]
MNPDLDRLQSYPFQKLSALLSGVTPDPALKPISLHIGEPKHPTPEFIKKALADNLGGLANYPTTLGGEGLRIAIAEWLRLRHDVGLDPHTEIIPINGSREALFAFAQAVIDPTAGPDPLVVCPNPFYQIYEGAALLAGVRPEFLNNLPDRRYACDFEQLPPEIWKRTQL